MSSPGSSGRDSGRGPARAPGGSAGTPPDLGFIHRFIPGDPSRPALLLLHGTGGDENDLIPLGPILAAEAALLSPRGQVLENGMPRFFRRLAEGVFDLEDLRLRTHELGDFVLAARRTYGLAREPVAVGFSNGANIAASMLLLEPGVLAGAILFRPMVPFVPERAPAVTGTPVLIAAGRSDPIALPDQAECLAEILRGAGADVTLHWDESGHTLALPAVDAARRWFQKAFPAGIAG